DVLQPGELRNDTHGLSASGIGKQTIRGKSLRTDDKAAASPASLLRRRSIAHAKAVWCRTHCLPSSPDFPESRGKLSEVMASDAHRPFANRWTPISIWLGLSPPATGATMLTETGPDMLVFTGNDAALGHVTLQIGAYTDRHPRR